MKRIVKGVVGLTTVLGGIVGQASAAEIVKFGWIPVVAPYEAAFCTDELLKSTGYDVEWTKFDSGPAIISAMASGSVPIAFLGSPPAAAAISQGLDIEVFWVVSSISTGEGLIVRPQSGIRTAQDLKGKTLAAPLGSTSHYALMAALQHYKLSGSDVEVVGMTPPEIAAAWTRGDIDGAFIWDPVLSKLKDDGGHVLVDAAEVAKWGNAILNLLVVRRDWAKEHPDFMEKFVKQIGARDAAYRNNPQSWSADSDDAKCLEKAEGIAPAEVPKILETFQFPSIQEQTTASWLGGGKDGQVAKWLRLTAEFLKDQGKIGTVLNDYSVGVSPEWATAAAKLP